MIIITGNYTGNVGKTTIAQKCLKPRIPNCEIISVESINSDGTENEKISGDKFSQILDDAFKYDSAILDVGSSNIESFLEKMKEFEGSEHFITKYIVPTVGDKKQIEDTVSFVRELSALGIPKENIVVVFNRVDKKENIREVFSRVFNESNKAIIDEKLCIYDSELMSRLITENDNRDIIDIANDPTDYLSLIRDAKSVNERLTLTRKLGTKALASGVMKNMDSVFDFIFSDIAELQSQNEVSE
jgi:hypothetical protein